MNETWNLQRQFSVVFAACHIEGQGVYFQGPTVTRLATKEVLTFSEEVFEVPSRLELGVF